MNWPAVRVDPADEREHPGVPVEAWWFWGAAADGSGGLYVGFEVTGRRFDYWAGLVRAGAPYLHVVELDGTGRRAGLEIKPPEMWADHVCDEPFRQWSVGNEAHGVLLEDPAEAWFGAYGDVVPVTFDVEWYAAGDPVVIDGGYRQAGEIDAVVELLEGPVHLRGPAARVHVWGRPWVPNLPAGPREPAWGLRAPYARRDGTAVEQLLVGTEWSGWPVPGHDGDQDGGRALRA